MLSGISHDLRTPLTRLKLQLSFLNQKDLVKKMSDDIQEMERMLNEYLEFASQQKSEETELTDINNIVKEVVQFLKERIIICEKFGIDESRIILDPGFGFGKTYENNFSLSLVDFNNEPYLSRLWCNPNPPIGIIN